MLEAVHYQGIIHRDIKPDNLLLSDDQVLKIGDFGVSEMFGKPDNMKVSKSAGSPAFMPPELCGKHGEVSGTAADIWSMGVTLYCLKYGKIPFNRPGVLEIYDAIRLDEPVLPEDEDPAFVDLLTKILEKDPERRITIPQLRVCFPTLRFSRASLCSTSFAKAWMFLNFRNIHGLPRGGLIRCCLQRIIASTCSSLPTSWNSAVPLPER